METWMKALIGVIALVVIALTLFFTFRSSKQATLTPTITPSATPIPPVTPIPTAAATVAPQATVAPTSAAALSLHTAEAFLGKDFPGNDIACYDMTVAANKLLTMRQILAQHPDAVGVVFGISGANVNTGPQTMWVKSGWGNSTVNANRAVIALAAFSQISLTPDQVTTNIPEAAYDNPVINT